jgi:hypothetical protein
MRRRKLIAAVAIGMLALVAVGAFALLWPWSETASRITSENYARIHYRMSRAEVEAVLGPPGDYRTGPTAKRTKLENDAMWMSMQWVQNTSIWIADAAEIRVHYGRYSQDAEGAVGATGFALEPETSFFVIARWRAERQWRRWFP